MNAATKAKKLLLRKKKKEVITPDDYVSSGSALLNLAVSGTTFGCFIKGHYYFFVGDSSSGKTFLTMTMLAEAANKESFDGYDFVYNGTTERGALMDITKFFGSKVKKRLKTVYSENIEDFYYDLDDRLDGGKPFIYILDSMDGLDSEADQAKFREQKKANRKGRESAGSYGDGKAKKNSQTLRKMLTRLHSSGSILIVIGQTRDNIGFGFETRTRSGGRSLKFYATLEMWSSVYKHIKKKVLGKDREQGIISQVQVKKNRITGRDRTVRIPIYHSFGIDDVGSCVDYLIEEGHWKKKGGRINAKELDYLGFRDDLIKHIEHEQRERELRAVVRKTWNDIEEACSIKRKKRYS